jgi:hypothetical protein
VRSASLVDDHVIWVRGPIRAPASTIVATSSRRIIDSNYCLSPQAPAFNHGLLDARGPGAHERRQCPGVRVATAARHALVVSVRYTLNTNHPTSAVAMKLSEQILKAGTSAPANYESRTQ